MIIKTCIDCNRDKVNNDFPIHHRDSNGNVVYRNQCKQCRQKITYSCFMKRRQEDPITKNKDNARKRAERLDDSKRARFILEDSRKSDKKKNRANDLTIEFIQQTIVKGCIYCGDTQTKMCLDRIDNSKGHMMDNVNPSCVRCNYIRNSMPYEAWINIVPSIKESYINGLFNNWKTRFW